MVLRVQRLLQRCKVTILFNTLFTFRKIFLRVTSLRTKECNCSVSAQWQISFLHWNIWLSNGFKNSIHFAQSSGHDLKSAGRAQLREFLIGEEKPDNSKTHADENDLSEDAYRQSEQDETADQLDNELTDAGLHA